MRDNDTLYNLLSPFGRRLINMLTGQNAKDFLTCYPDHNPIAKWLEEEHADDIENLADQTIDF